MIRALIDQPENTPITLSLLSVTKFSEWLSSQIPSIQNWVALNKFEPTVASFLILPTEAASAIAIIDALDMWSWGNLPTNLPPAIYQLHPDTSAEFSDQTALVWGLGAYEFLRYKPGRAKFPQLVWPIKCNRSAIEPLLSAIYSARDLINTPIQDMNPETLAQSAQSLALLYGASFKQVVGDALLTENFPLVHAVGRASVHAPRLIDLQWGEKSHPKVTLVGKGVCFDSGGLDIKSSDGMLQMKKDMAGAAITLSIAELVMQAKLPVFLRVLIPAVENAVSGNSYHPGDVLPSRKGISVEIGNTDAEGRLILSDALTEAASASPELIIDVATLTGAARVALGTDISAFFTNTDAVAEALSKAAMSVQEPIWRMPLHTPYRKMLDSNIAQINNVASMGYGGAIYGALFLKEFLPTDIDWIHFDVMAWNLSPRPGRPEGGEATALRGIFAYLKQRYAA